jgi:hypothetical protein
MSSYTTHRRARNYFFDPSSGSVTFGKSYGELSYNGLPVESDAHSGMVETVILPNMVVTETIDGGEKRIHLKKVRTSHSALGPHKNVLIEPNIGGTTKRSGGKNEMVMMVPSKQRVAYIKPIVGGAPTKYKVVADLKSGKVVVPVSVEVKPVMKNLSDKLIIEPEAHYIRAELKAGKTKTRSTKLKTSPISDLLP